MVRFITDEEGHLSMVRNGLRRLLYIRIAPRFQSGVDLVNDRRSQIPAYELSPSGGNRRR
jgi:hypothetical protein